MQFIQQTLEQSYDTTLSNFTAFEGGWEADIYAYEVNEQALVIRLMHGNDGDEKVQREYNGMRLLHQLGYRVPHVHKVALRSESRFGQPYIIMDWLKGGELFGRQVTTEAGFTRFAGLIRELHQLDWQRVVDFPASDPFAFVDAKYVEYRAIAEQVLPGFMPAIEWLKAQRDDFAAESYSILHGDFHPWNILETPDEKLWVIDWSGFEIGDPRFDIAWTWLILDISLGREQSQRFADEFGLYDPFKAIAIIRRLGTVYLSLTSSTVDAGMREEAQVGMRRELVPLKGLYEEYLQIGGVPLAVIEAFLDDNV